MNEPLDLTTVALVKHFVVEALNRYEKRIIINSERTQVEVVNDVEGVLRVNLYYTIRATGDSENLVFPFYKDID